MSPWRRRLQRLLELAGAARSGAASACCGGRRACRRAGIGAEERRRRPLFPFGLPAQQGSLKQESSAAFLGVGESSYVLVLDLTYRLSEKGTLLSNLVTQSSIFFNRYRKNMASRVSEPEALASSVRSNPDCPETQADSAYIEGLKHSSKGALHDLGADFPCGVAANHRAT